MIFDSMYDRRELLDDLAQSPEADEARAAVSNMRKRIAHAEMEEEYGSIGQPGIAQVEASGP